VLRILVSLLLARMAHLVKMVNAFAQKAALVINAKKG